MVDVEIAVVVVSLLLLTTKVQLLQRYKKHPDGNQLLHPRAKKKVFYFGKQMQDDRTTSNSTILYYKIKRNINSQSNQLSCTLCTHVPWYIEMLEMYFCTRCRCRLYQEAFLLLRGSDLALVLQPLFESIKSVLINPQLIYLDGKTSCFNNLFCYQFMSFTNNIFNHSLSLFYLFPHLQLYLSF